MLYTYAELKALSTARLRVLQFAYFCMCLEHRSDYAHTSSLMFTMLQNIVDILRDRKERVFGPRCLLNTNSDPRWKLADNRRVVSNDR